MPRSPLVLSIGISSTQSGSPCSSPSMSRRIWDSFMSSTSPATGLGIGHPAPLRLLVHLLSLLFALLGAPTGWAVQLFFGFASTSYLCNGQARTAVPTWLAPTVIGLNFAALAIAIAALTVALVLVRRTTHEHRQRFGGFLFVCVGCSRFLVVWSVFISIVFFVAILANSLSLFLFSSCKF